MEYFKDADIDTTTSISEPIIIEEKEPLETSIDAETVEINEEKEKEIKSNKIEPETIELELPPAKSIINQLIPQENKFWRFTFKNAANTENFKKVIESIPDYNLTVEFDIRQDKPDVIIKQGDNIIGKINLLLCDRRDANLVEKYYCKIYFYHFKDKVIYDTVKTAVLTFFNKLKMQKSNTNKVTGGKHYKKRKTINKKRNNKKKTKRKIRK
jgi:hypothetical protein